MWFLANVLVLINFIKTKFIKLVNVVGKWYSERNVFKYNNSDLYIPLLDLENSMSKPVRIIWYDLETTGLNPFHNKIIEISAIDNYGNIFDRLLKIGEPLDPKVVEITKITDETLQTQGGDYNEVLNDFYTYINMNTQTNDTSAKNNTKTFMIAHNGDSFDRMFLKTQLKTLIPGFKFHTSIYFIDSLNLSRYLYPTIYSHSLLSLSKYFSVNNANAHRAMSDVNTLKRLWDIFEKQYETKHNTRDIVHIYKTIYF